MGVFSENKSVNELINISGELMDVGAAAAVLSWDQETHMPPSGAGVRAMQLATLAGTYHEKLTAPRVDRALKKFEEKPGNNDFDRGLARELRREYDKATKLPKKLVMEISEAQSRAFDSWQKAKKESDFKRFEPELIRILELKVKASQLLAGPGQSVYDTMLDDHESGLTEAEVERAFGEVKADIVRLGTKLARITKDADSDIKERKYDLDRQWEFGIRIATEMGYDFSAGRQDKSAHPFTTSFGTTDVRITTWQNESDIRPALFATIHEAGHALYEQGVNKMLERTHLATGQGLIMHESQSRMWENVVGRSPEFWKHYYGELQKVFPEQLKGIDESNFVRAVNVVKPSLIRVEADEVTYGLHIIVRFEIEKELVTGRIKVADLPNLWRRKMKEVLGIEPEDDRTGVLQDVHWSHGSFGYFPTYLLGTMTAAQIWEKIGEQIPDIAQQISQGKLKTLRDWLRENLHKYGRVYTPQELLKKVTGETLNSKYYVNYLEKKFEKIFE